MRMISCLCCCLLWATAVNAADGDTLYKASRRFSVTELKLNMVNVCQAEYLKWRGDTILRETDSIAITYLQQYWAVVNRRYAAGDMKSAHWQDIHPWSAAFISYVLQQAGAGDRFPYSETHSNYITWARDNALKNNNAIFLAYAVCDSMAAWPQPGDLLCKNRDGKQYTLTGIKAGNISHCDVVVEVDTLTRTVYTIGGNLNNSVVKRVVHLDANGFIDKTASWQLMDVPGSAKDGPQDQYFGMIRLQDPAMRMMFLTKKE